jgi:hypothetical protein
MRKKRKSYSKGGDISLNRFWRDLFDNHLFKSQINSRRSQDDDYESMSWTICCRCHWRRNIPVRCGVFIRRDRFSESIFMYKISIQLRLPSGFLEIHVALQLTSGQFPWASSCENSAQNLLDKSGNLQCIISRWMSALLTGWKFTVFHRQDFGSQDWKWIFMRSDFILNFQYHRTLSLQPHRRTLTWFETTSPFFWTIQFLVLREWTIHEIQTKAAIRCDRVSIPKQTIALLLLGL